SAPVRASARVWPVTDRTIECGAIHSGRLVDVTIRPYSGAESMTDARAASHWDTAGASEPTLAPEQLRARRIALGLTQAQLAARLGVASNTLARWERGELRPQFPARIASRLVRLEGVRPPAVRPARRSGPPQERTNLPVSLTSFVGREQQLVQLRRLFESTRLLTLTGMGGIGKTRLALQLAAGLDPPDGGWVGGLGGLAGPMVVAQAVARVVGVPEQPGRAPASSLVNALRRRQLVVVLDNCEHLAQASAELVQQLLVACPDLRIVATSRERLHVPGEQVWLVP